MNMKSDENLTLTTEMLNRCKPVGGEGGKAKRAFCPFHGGDKQRSLRVDNETGHFSCFQCGCWGYMDWAREKWKIEKGIFETDFFEIKKYSLKDLKDMFREHYKRLREKASQPKLNLPKEFHPVYSKTKPGSYVRDLFLDARKYLFSRGIEKEDCVFYDIRYSYEGKYANRVIVPIVMNGELMGWIGRAINKHAQPKHLKSSNDFSSLIFNYDNLDKDKPVIVCEGVFDAITVGMNACSIFGKRLSDSQISILSQFKNKIVIFDGDAKHQTLAAAKELSAKVVLIPDHNEDPSSLGRESVWHLINNNTYDVNSPEIILQLMGEE